MTPRFATTIANLSPKTRQMAGEHLRQYVERGGYPSDQWAILKARYLELTRESEDECET